MDIISLEELETLDPTTKIVELPALTAKLGKPVNVRIQRISPLDLLKLYNIPMDEINAIAASGDDGQGYGDLVEEQMKTFDVDDYQNMVSSVMTKGIVEPEPSERFIKKIEADSVYLFGQIMEFTSPKENAEATARFRKDE